ncbi:unnamed protein product [Symbiodinium sp. CCMP2592]|nr:unnamed protein product [Symbiodinium sp. CCMP2592]
MPPLDRGQNVVFIVDPGVMSEPSETYTRAHNVYSRTPSVFTHVITGNVKAAGMFASEFPGVATFGCFDVGSYKAGQCIRSQLAKAKIGRYQAWDLLPRQCDMEARLLFRHGTDEDQELLCCRLGVLHSLTHSLTHSIRSALKRRKTLGVTAGHLTYIVGREVFHFCRSINPIDAKPHKHLTMPAGSGDSSASWLTIPLPHPSTLRPLVSKADKQKAVLMKYDSRNQKKDANAKALNDEDVVQHAAEIGEEELQPLNYLARHGSLHKELWHLLDAGRLVSFSPEFNQLSAAMEQRLFTIALVRSSLHEDLLKKELLEWVTQELQRPSNDRFFRPHLAPPQKDVVEVAPAAGRPRLRHVLGARATARDRPRIRRSMAAMTERSLGCCRTWTRTRTRRLRRSLRRILMRAMPRKFHD